MKYIFFDNKIQEIVSKNHRSQNFMSQVKKCKLPAIKVLQFNNQLYIEINNLQQILHQMFNLVQNYRINPSLLEKLLLKQMCKQPPFSKEKFKSAITKYKNLSTSTLDFISQKYLKIVIKNDKCLTNIANIANMCINLDIWPLYFKISLFIIISKPNKIAYNSSKMF